MCAEIIDFEISVKLKKHHYTAFANKDEAEHGSISYCATLILQRYPINSKGKFS